MKKILTILVVLFISKFGFAQTKYDEYGRLYLDDESFRLFGTSKEFLKAKDSKIYVLVNREKKMPMGKFLRYFYGIENWLIRNGVPKKSIVMSAGEDKDQQFTQIWFVKNTENPPSFKELSIEEKLKEKIKKKILFDTNCIDCDESPFIKLFIFREGVDYLSKVLQSNPKSKALLKIPRFEYLKSKKERTKLMSEIFIRLKDNQISKDRVLIQFTSVMNAEFYIIPNIAK